MASNVTPDADRRSTSRHRRRHRGALALRRIGRGRGADRRPRPTSTTPSPSRSARHKSGALPAHERAAILDRAAAALLERQEEFARSITAESAKPIKTARVEAARAVDTFRFSAAVARTITGETIPLDASSAGVGKFGFVLRVPIGVIGAISPFNFPLNLVAHKVAPAIAAGCPGCPEAGVGHAAHRAEAGRRCCSTIAVCPPGWLNVVTAPGRVANRLVEHRDVAMITFTGSPPVGWGIRDRARPQEGEPRARQQLPRHHRARRRLEERGAEDRGRRLFVRRPVVHLGAAPVRAVVDRRSVHRSLVAEVEALVVGNPNDDNTDVSALIDTGETERVKSWVDEAVTQGAELRTGGDLDADGVLRPTVLTNVQPDMEVCRNEVFGPVVGIQAYDRYEEALELANDTPLRPAGRGVHLGPRQGATGGPGRSISVV